MRRSEATDKGATVGHPSLARLRATIAAEAEMRTISHAVGGGGGPQPVAAPRVRHRARLALLIVALLMAFASGALVAVAWDALSEIDARGPMDPTR